MAYKLDVFASQLNASSWMTNIKFSVFTILLFVYVLTTSNTVGAEVVFIYDNDIRQNRYLIAAGNAL